MRGPPSEQTEDVSEVGPRLDVAELAAREQRCEARVHDATVIASDEEPVLATDSFAAQCELTHVVVNRKTTVFEEAREPDTLIACVANAVGDRGLVENALVLGIAPREERIDDVLRSLLA